MRRLATWFFAFALLVLLTACRGSGTTPSAGPQEAAGSGAVAPRKVTIGYIPILIYAPYFIAIDKGYFAEQGIEAYLEPLAGGADMLVQTAAGNFDVGAGGIGSAFFNLAARSVQENKELPMFIVAPLHAERPPLTTPLVVSKKAYESGQITKISDLRGKKVAINAFGAATEYWLERALAKGGLTFKDVEVVAVPFQNAAAALDNGSIAGAMLGEPFATQAAQQGLITILSNDFLDGDQPTAVYYNTNWAKKNPKLAEGFMIAYLKAVRDLERPDGWQDETNVKILEKYTRVPAEVIKASARPYNDPNGRVNIQSLENQQTFFRSVGRLTYDRPLEIPKLIDPTFAQKAVHVLGEVRQ